MLLRIALRNLLQARRRTLLLGAALAAVTALLVLLMALSAGIGDTMIRSATTLASGHVNVGGFFKARSSDAAPFVRGVSELRALVERELPELEHMVDRARGWARVVSSEGSMQVGLTGINVADESRLMETLRLVPESDYRDGGRDEVLGDPRSLAETEGAIVFAAQARRLGLRVGDPLTIVAETMQGQRNSAEVEVAAVVDDIGFMSNFSMFVSKRTLRKLYRLGEDVSGVVQVYLRDAKMAPAVMERLRTALEREGHELLPHEPTPFFAKFSSVSGEAWTGQRLDTTIWKDEISFLGWILGAVDTVSFTLVGTLLVIIAIGITNSMWISVRERTNEIGTLRAIGMGRRQVMAMFLYEAGLLGLVFTGLGALSGAGVALLLDWAEIRVGIEAVSAVLMSDVLHLVVEPKDVIRAVVGFSFVAAGAALWPAIRAARLQPVTAIHHVG